MAHTCINEQRIRDLERQEAVMGIKIDNLVTTMNSLMWWIKALVRAMIPIIASGIGVLFWEVFKK